MTDTAVEIELPRASADALYDLAAIMRGDRDDPLAGLIEDALDTYAWIVRQQAAGHVVAALPTDVRAHLETCPDAPAVIVPSLVDFAPAGATEHLMAWLDGATPKPPQEQPS